MSFHLRFLIPMFGMVSGGLISIANAQENNLPGRDEVGIGGPYLVEMFADWELRCVRQEEGDIEPCQMYQLLRNEAGNPVAEFTLIALPSTSAVRAGATIVSPLETLLTEDVLVSIDQGDVRRYPFNFCTSDGCYSQLGFSDNDVALMKSGAEAQIRIVAAGAPQTPVILSASLKGFTAAFEWLADRMDTITGQ